MNVVEFVNCTRRKLFK